jgi:transcription factor C subunit 7
VLSLPRLPQRIYCSPYYRCIQTIVPPARALQLPIYLDEGIGEWYGRLQLNSSPDHPTPLNVEEWPGFFPGVEFQRGITGIVGERRGETMAEVHKRVRKALDRIIKDADEQGLERILLCTHAATNIALGRALTKDPEV